MAASETRATGPRPDVGTELQELLLARADIAPELEAWTEVRAAARRQLGALDEQLAAIDAEGSWSSTKGPAFAMTFDGPEPRGRTPAAEAIAEFARTPAKFAEAQSRPDFCTLGGVRVKLGMREERDGSLTLLMSVPRVQGFQRPEVELPLRDAGSGSLVRGRLRQLENQLGELAEHREGIANERANAIEDASEADVQVADLTDRLDAIDTGVAVTRASIDPRAALVEQRQGIQARLEELAGLERQFEQARRPFDAAVQTAIEEEDRAQERLEALRGALGTAADGPEVTLRDEAARVVDAVDERLQRATPGADLAPEPVGSLHGIPVRVGLAAGRATLVLSGAPETELRVERGREAAAVDVLDARARAGAEVDRALRELNAQPPFEHREERDALRAQLSEIRPELVQPPAAQEQAREADPRVELQQLRGAKQSFDRQHAGALEAARAGLTQATTLRDMIRRHQPAADGAFEMTVGDRAIRDPGLAAERLDERLNAAGRSGIAPQEVSAELERLPVVATVAGREGELHLLLAVKGLRAETEVGIPVTERTRARGARLMEALKGKIAALPTLREANRRHAVAAGKYQALRRQGFPQQARLSALEASVGNGRGAGTGPGSAVDTARAGYPKRLRPTRQPAGAASTGPPKTAQQQAHKSTRPVIEVA